MKKLLNSKPFIKGIVCLITLVIMIGLSIWFSFSVSRVPDVNFYAWAINKIGEYYSFHITEPDFTFLYVVSFIFIYIYTLAILGGIGYAVYLYIKTKRHFSFVLLAAALTLLIPYFFVIGGSSSIIKALLSLAQFENDPYMVLHVILAFLLIILFLIYTVALPLFYANGVVYTLKEKETITDTSNSNEEETGEDEEEQMVENILNETSESEVDIENMTKEEVAELIRQIVREELSRMPQQNQSPTVNFGQPLVVQYFNGPAPVPGNKKATRIASTPVKEIESETAVTEPAEEIKEVPTPVVATPVVEEPKAEPVVEEEKVGDTGEQEEGEENKNAIIRIPFADRIKNADEELRSNYSAIKNEILAYGVKSRVSNAGDTFRLHRKTYIKLIVAGKGLKLYMALDPRDYENSTIPFQDVGNKAAYTEIPFAFKVKSGLSFRRCFQLIQETMEKDGLVKGEVQNIDWASNVAESVDDNDNDD